MKNPVHACRIPQYPWPLKLVTWLTVLLQLALPFNAQLFAAQAALLAPAGRPPRTYPSPVLTPQHVVVNHAIPVVEPPSLELRFSDPPSDIEISRARVFPVPL